MTIDDISSSEALKAELGRATRQIAALELTIRTLESNAHLEWRNAFAVVAQQAEREFSDPEHDAIRLQMELVQARKVIAGLRRGFFIYTMSWRKRIVRRMLPGRLRRLWDTRHFDKVAATIRASGLFDLDWYAMMNPDVSASGLDPIRHYVEHGAAEGREPRPDFDSAVYLSMRPLMSVLGMNPFLHFILSPEGQALQRAQGRSRA